MHTLQTFFRKLHGFHVHKPGKAWKPIIRILQSVGLLLAVGFLIDFLPIDLAIILVMVVAAQASVWLGVGGHYIGRRRHVVPVGPDHDQIATGNAWELI